MAHLSSLLEHAAAEHPDRKHYSEKSVVYTGTSVTVSKPFQARTVLTGTQTMKTGTYATYTAVSLKAK